MELSPLSSSFSSIAQFTEATVKTAPSKTERNPSNQEDQQAVIAKLRARDQEVRAHEQAHAAAAGGLATGGATFTFQQGPDGRQYAVGGEVTIDTTPVPGDPDATIRKARQIRAAALAPIEPSAQDRAVAASASTLEAQAKQELQQKKEEEQSKSSPKSTSQKIDIFV